MAKTNKEIMILLNRIKEPGVGRQELTELCNHYLKLMSYSGVSIKIRKKLYNYSFEPIRYKEKIINIAENTFMSILEKM